MNLKLYNTLSRSLEELRPIDPNNVRIYSCWPTVYGEPHLGNMRKYFIDDLLKNTIKNICGYPTTHVVNITDVGHLTGENQWDADHGEDKMEKWARREWITARDVAKKYETLFHENCRALLLDPFDVTPRATDHIREQIEMIQSLEKNGYTYTIPGDGIYMDTKNIAKYGQLMGTHYKEHIAWLQWGARIDDEGKKNVTDFALWKFNTTGKKRDMERDSPRGRGFPGWHIECSAMSIKYLGKHFDIHTWGIDHIPIHHTNEIVQSECSIADHPWVNYWIHYQFLNINGEKISKSLGNVVTLKDIFDRWYSAYDLRYFFLQAHYRSFQDFTRENLEAASKGRKKIRLVANEWYPHEEITKHLLDDLNTSAFLAALHKHGISEKLNNIYKVYQNEKQVSEFVPDHIKALWEQRRSAKLAKDYNRADALRDELYRLWRESVDSKESYTLKKL